MTILKTVLRVLFPANLDAVFSEEGKEKTAISIAARYARGNHGMIATSGSWRRFWLEWRWARYPWAMK